MSVRSIDITTGAETSRDYTQAELDAIDATKPSAASLIAAKKQAIRAVREGILNRLAGIALAADLSGDTATTAAYVIVRQGLLDITDAWPTEPEQIDGLVTSRYGELVMQCTPQMISAFAQVDA